VTNKLSQEGKIVIRPVKGGVMLYLPEEAPVSKSLGDEALNTDFHRVLSVIIISAHS